MARPRASSTIRACPVGSELDNSSASPSMPTPANRRTAVATGLADAGSAGPATGPTGPAGSTPPPSVPSPAVASGRPLPRSVGRTAPFRRPFRRPSPAGRQRPTPRARRPDRPGRSRPARRPPPAGRRVRRLAVPMGRTPRVGPAVGPSPPTTPESTGPRERFAHVAPLPPLDRRLQPRPGRSPRPSTSRTARGAGSPGDTQAGPAVGLQPGDVLALEDHVTVVGLLQPADDVEQCRLSGTVGTDKPGDRAGHDGEVHVGRGRRRPRNGPPPRATRAPAPDPATAWARRTRPRPPRVNGPAPRPVGPGGRFGADGRYRPRRAIRAGGRDDEGRVRAHDGSSPHRHGRGHLTGASSGTGPAPGSAGGTGLTLQRREFDRGRVVPGGPASALGRETQGRGSAAG